MWQELEEDDPELTVCSPPCTAFTPLQNRNYHRMDYDKVVALVGDGLDHVATSCEVAEWQDDRGKLFLLEHPKPSKAWDEPEMVALRKRPGVYTCVVDQCAYGLCVKDWPNKKTTQWVTNSKHIAQQLQRRCTGDHPHEALLGGLAAKAAIYPPSLCKAIVKGLKQHLRHKQQQPATVQHAEQSLAWPAEVQSVEEEDIEDMLDREIDREQRVVAQAPSTAAVLEEDKAKVRKMHNNLGHPELRSFIRFLRAGRVREEVVKWVSKEFRCDECLTKAVPKAPRPAVVPKCYKPGIAVGLDLFYIQDHMRQKSIPILNVVDMGTNYQMIEMLADKAPETVWRAFWRTWARTFGMPLYMAMDEGLEFRGELSQWCADFGCIVFKAAGRSPWQQGRVERHGGIIKDMIQHARASAALSSEQELQQLLYECESAKNRYMNRSGYSPVQRQIGQWPRVPGSLMSDELIDPALQMQDTSEDFDRTLELRQLAQEAFMKMSSQDAAARALRARGRPQRVFKPGDVVYVYRVLRKKKSVRGDDVSAVPKPGKKATWIGPGHVLALEGSVVWINMFGELWRASVEQTREATTLEKMGAEIVAESFGEMQERLKRSAHRPGYRDVTGEAEEVPDLDGAGDRDEVAEEGRLRGQPRVRFALEDGEEAANRRQSAGSEMDSAEHSQVEPESVQDEESGGDTPMRGARGVSKATVPEPDEEILNMQPTVADQERSAMQEAERLATDAIASSVAANQALDGGPQDYQALRRSTQQRWVRRHESPYFAEFFLQTAEAEEKTVCEEPKQDYWVFDSHKNVLQRHHVHWRKALFNPSQAEDSPIPLRALKKDRKTRRMQGDGSVRECTDEWSLFTKREERFSWWKGITEFRVDSHYLQHGKGIPAKKRGEGEIFPHEIAAEDWPAWEEQDRAEFQKIVDSGALRVLSPEESARVRKELEMEGKTDRILPSRMVRRLKPAEEPGAPRVKKSRFCIRGDRDPDAIFLSRFAPTVTTSNLQVLIQVAMNKAFQGVVGDLKSAFTQSLPLFRAGGKLYCRSVGGSMPGLEEDQLAEIVLGCYGLCDAPKHWRETLVSFLKEELGYKQSALDPCTFLLHGPEGLHGMVAVEIDDLLMFGDSVHEEKMQQLQQRFTFGKLQAIDEHGVNFNGRRLRRKGNTIEIDMKAFIEERLEGVELSKERAKQKEERLTEEETSSVRRTCGSLNWAGREGRPDAAAAASMYSSLMTEMKISDVLELNKTVERLKQDADLALKVQAIPEARMKWGVVSDASWANARGGKTQGGHMLLAFDQDLLEGKQAVCNLLHWKSAKLSRTVNSTLAAETQSLARGIGDLLWMIVMYQEMVNPNFQVREWRKYVERAGYTAFTKGGEKSCEALAEALAIVDAKSLYDLLANETGGGADRRTALDVQVLREELSEMRGRIRWVEHWNMPADCLTKRQGRVEPLLALLRSGRLQTTALGVVKHNAHRWPGKHPTSNLPAPGLGLWLWPPMINHATESDGMPNCAHVFIGDVMIFRATAPIQAGQEVLDRYSTPLADHFEFTLHTLAAHGMRDPVYEAAAARWQEGGAKLSNEKAQLVESLTSIERKVTWSNGRLASEP
eukprot:s1441_g25.t1